MNQIAVATSPVTPTSVVRPRAPGQWENDTQGKVAGRTFFLAVVAILLLAASAAARTACQAAKPPGAHDWWSWRQVGGQRCWYPGRSGIGKATLYWPPAESQAAQAMPVPAIPAPAVSLPARSLPFAERWPK